MRALWRWTWCLLPVLACASQARSTIGRTVQIAPHESGELPRHSWVVLTNGTRVPVDGGGFSRDSVVGTVGATGRFAAPRDSVAFVEERRVRAAGSTSGLLAGAYRELVLTGLITLAALMPLMSLQ